MKKFLILLAILSLPLAAKEMPPELAICYEREFTFNELEYYEERELVDVFCNSKLMSSHLKKTIDLDWRRKELKKGLYGDSIEYREAFKDYERSKFGSLTCDNNASRIARFLKNEFKYKDEQLLCNGFKEGSQELKWAQSYFMGDHDKIVKFFSDPKSLDIKEAREYKALAFKHNYKQKMKESVYSERFDAYLGTTKSKSPLIEAEIKELNKYRKRLYIEWARMMGVSLKEFVPEMASILYAKTEKGRFYYYEKEGWKKKTTPPIFIE